MTIDEAIKLRIDRFNRLWLNTVGHSFEEDDKIQKERVEKEHPIWEKKVKARFKELGLKDKEEYYDWVDEHGSDKKVVELFNEEPRSTSLYPYEMFCIKEAKKLAKFIQKKGGNQEEIWNSYFAETSIYEGIKKLKKEGLRWDSGHSDNTFGMSVRFAMVLLFYPDMFQYQHGALSYLVGDEGYHDDRSDIPKLDEEK